METSTAVSTKGPQAADEKTKFNTEEALAIIKETVEATIQDAEYSHSKVPTWNSAIIVSSLKKLKEMNQNYKYVVTCLIMQKNGAGFYAGSSVYWDNLHDGSASHRHETKSLYAIVNVFGLSV
ncbi:Tctex-1 family-domain-containing protein [Radiomyces spectabilis]|uniref:Tctex-1 family-domain-containing protein n=1 Tax=Radiomyces spectabilis TaxID=64574 RepID=UPI0022211B8F|nr:Tctex-1 family-domain-containing protein [Radiomyces spectabilis]KAI8369555.1 Tctex-1 family-domain-containing protein [Radiomyces spectabilis]